MKKKILALVTALILTAGLLVTPASAAGATRFADIPDQTTATAVEVLRLMGVLDGYGDGTFRPGAILNRAQFCKMAVYAMDGGQSAAIVLDNEQLNPSQFNSQRPLSDLGYFASALPD